MNKLFLIISLTIGSILFSQESRLYQFVSDKPNESFISLEAGTSTGISVFTSSVQLSFLYSFLLTKGFSITTDLMLYNYNISDSLKIKAGFGGGMLFRPELNDFSSDAYLRFPIIGEYKNIYISVVPMPGYTMFEYVNSFVFNISINLGYKFDLYKDGK